MGIECDGTTYHYSRNARDRDRLREAVLRSLGWKLHRIWGPSWYRDRPGEERRLRDAIDTALHSQEHIEPAGSPVQAVELTYEDLLLDQTPAWVEPYRVVSLPRPRAYNPSDLTARAEVQSYIQQTVAEEGPIVDELIIRRVIEAWNLHVTERRREAVRRVLGALIGAGTFIRRGNALCFPEQRYGIVRGPIDDDPRTLRDIKSIPDIELSEAVARLVNEARAASSTELQQRTARIFGWRRNGSSIQAALARTIDELVAGGRVRRVGDRLEAANHVPVQ